MQEHRPRVAMPVASHPRKFNNLVLLFGVHVEVSVVHPRLGKRTIGVTVVLRLPSFPTLGSQWKGPTVPGLVCVLVGCTH